jgi:hypothetical protein
VSRLAWLSGDLGRRIEHLLRDGLHADLKRLPRTTRLPRAILIEDHAPMGQLVEAGIKAARHMETELAKEYPVMHHEMGPVWTGVIQAIPGGMA